MNKEIIEELNSDEQLVIGIVTQLNEDPLFDYLWRADFPQDGEYCVWGESTYEYALNGSMGAI